MRIFIATMIVLMVLWSVIVWMSQPSTTVAGKTNLVWTSDDNPLRKEQINLFKNLNPKYHLKLDPVNEGMEKVIVQSMGGVGPDLFDCRDASQLSAYVRADIAWDVTERLAKNGIDIKRDVWSATQPLCIWEGRTYGVPTNIAPDAIWFHKDLFDAAGLPYPKTPWHWDDFIALAKALTKKGTAVTSQYGFMFDWYNWPHFLKGFGARTFTPDGTRCIIDSPEAIRAVQLMRDLVYKYKVCPSPVEEAGMASNGGWGSGTINYFGAKRAAMALGGRWWFVNLRSFEGLHLGVAESPFGTDRKFLAIARATLINKHSTRREDALKFLLYLASPDYAKLVDRQADGSPAFQKYSLLKQSGLEDPDPGVWIEAAKVSEPELMSPYVDGHVVSKIINDQLDLVRSDVKTAAQALKEAAKQINEAIQDQLREDPRLRERWIQATRSAR